VERLIPPPRQLRLLRSRLGGIIRDIPARSPAKPSSRLERPLARAERPLKIRDRRSAPTLFKLY
jgi:hypothetical protein